MYIYIIDPSQATMRRTPTLLQMNQLSTFGKMHTFSCVCRQGTRCHTGVQLYMDSNRDPFKGRQMHDHTGPSKAPR